MSDANLTLTGLFEQAGTELKIYDLGRRIRALSADEFLRIEQMQTPYPTPYQQHAWLALLLLNPDNRAQNAVWFLKLPLDEQGYLIGAVRDDILGRLLQNVEASVAGVPQEDALKENPYAFKPSDEKMAVFHALAARESQQSASEYYEAVQAYLQADELTELWQNLALQGLADLIVRIDQADNEERLAQRLDELPQGMAALLLGLLEHSKYSEVLAQALQQQLNNSLGDANCNAIRVALCLRALSPSELTPELKAQLIHMLQTEIGEHPEVLSALATRCENWLMDAQLLQHFLEALARGEAGQLGFSRILVDLMFLPVHRILILQALRHESNSKQLRAATAAMFGGAFNAD
jgi:hypothetical protein